MTAHSELLAAISSAIEDIDRTRALDRVRKLLPHYDTIKAPDNGTAFLYSRVWHKLNDREYDQVGPSDLYLVSVVSKFSRAGVNRDEGLELDLLRHLRGDANAPPECDERQRVFHSTNLVDAGFALGSSSSNGSYCFDFSLERITPDGVKHLEAKTRNPAPDEISHGAIVFHQYIEGGYHVSSEQFNISNVSGQIGAIGANAKAEGNTFAQTWMQAAAGIELPTLATELALLRAELRKLATDVEHDQAVANIGSAEVAAKNNDGENTFKYLKAAGKWALDTATKIGTQVAVKAIEGAINLP